MNTSKKPSKLQLRIDLVLTVLFLITIFSMGILTVISNHDGILKAATRKSQLSPYLADPDDPSAWDMLEARIKSVDGYLAENCYAADRLGYLNSSFQYAIGKDLISTGAMQMLTLESGHLYDLQNYVPMQPAAQEILSMKAELPQDIPFLFVYEHPTIYSDAQMPEGYKVLDYSDEIANEITTLLREANVNLLDSREILPASGVPMEEYLMYTDQHWSTRASLIMAQRIAEETEALTGIALHPELLDISQFHTETYEKRFLGKYGQRVGTSNIDPDDITIYWPKYDTRITRYTNYLGDINELTGSFRDSVIRWKYLDPDPGKTYNIKAYFDYGLTENHDIFTNEAAADCTILLLKDSYSASIGSFLSLVANEVVSVDMRRSDSGVTDWVEKYDPDIVIVAYSMQMLRDDQYEFQ